MNRSFCLVFKGFPGGAQPTFLPFLNFFFFLYNFSQNYLQHKQTTNKSGDLLSRYQCLCRITLIHVSFLSFCNLFTSFLGQKIIWMSLQWHNLAEKPRPRQMKPLKVFFELFEFVYSPSVAAPRSKPAQPLRCLLQLHMWPLMQTLPNKHTHTHTRRHIPDIDMVCFPSLITYRVCCRRYTLNVNGSV